MNLTLRNRLCGYDRLIDFYTTDSHHSFQDLGSFVFLHIFQIHDNETAPTSHFPSASILLDREYMIYTAYYTFASQLLLALHWIDFINVTAPILLSFDSLLYSNLYIHFSCSFQSEYFFHSDMILAPPQLYTRKSPGLHCFILLAYMIQLALEKFILLLTSQRESELDECKFAGRGLPLAVVEPS